MWHWTLSTQVFKWAPVHILLPHPPPPKKKQKQKKHKGLGGGGGGVNSCFPLKAKYTFSVKDPHSKEQKKMSGSTILNLMHVYNYAFTLVSTVDTIPDEIEEFCRAYSTYHHHSYFAFYHSNNPFQVLCVYQQTSWGLHKLELKCGLELEFSWYWASQKHCW